jgi:hypothetical protein
MPKTRAYTRDELQGLRRADLQRLCKVSWASSAEADGRRTTSRAPMPSRTSSSQHWQTTLRRPSTSRRCPRRMAADHARRRVNLRDLCTAPPPVRHPGRSLPPRARLRPKLPPLPHHASRALPVPHPLRLVHPQAGGLNGRRRARTRRRQSRMVLLSSARLRAFPPSRSTHSQTHSPRNQHSPPSPPRPPSRLRHPQHHRPIPSKIHCPPPPSPSSPSLLHPHSQAPRPLTTSSPPNYRPVPTTTHPPRRPSSSRHFAQRSCTCVTSSPSLTRRPCSSTSRRAWKIGYKLLSPTSWQS